MSELSPIATYGDVVTTASDHVGIPRDQIEKFLGTLQMCGWHLTPVTSAPSSEASKQEQCHYCKEWYPWPVSYHHSESECAENQSSQAKEVTIASSAIPSASEQALRELLLTHADYDDGEGNKDAAVLRGRLLCIRDILRGT